MKLSNQDKAIEEILRNLSGETLDNVDNVLRALFMYALMQYSEGELVRFPYFGSFKFTYEGDSISLDGREANLDTMYFPSNDIKLNIGMLEDVKKKGGDITDLPIIQDLIHDINLQLQCVVNDVDIESSVYE